MNSRRGRCCSGRKSKLEEDRYIVQRLCHVPENKTENKKPKTNKVAVCFHISGVSPLGRGTITVKVPLSQPCFDHFLGPVLGAMMKQVCWHSRRSKAYRGLPEARGQSEAHGDSNLYTMGVRPCVTAKLPVLGRWFWNLILLNLAAASCYLHGGRFWRQQVPSPLWWRNLLQVWCAS